MKTKKIDLEISKTALLELYNTAATVQQQKDLNYLIDIIYELLNDN